MFGCLYLSSFISMPLKNNFSNFISPPTYTSPSMPIYRNPTQILSTETFYTYITVVPCIDIVIYAVYMSTFYPCSCAFFSLKIISTALTHFDHHGINNRPIHMVPRPTIIAIGLGLGPMWYLLPYIPVMPLLYGTTLKPWLSHGLVPFFVMHLFMLCLAKNKVLILYSYVKFAVVREVIAWESQ